MKIILDETVITSVRSCHVPGVTAPSLAALTTSDALPPGYFMPTAEDLSVFSPLAANPQVTGQGKGYPIVRLVDSGERHMQRLIAADQFSHRKVTQHDDAMIDGTDGTIWFGSILGFTRIEAKSGRYSEKVNQYVAIVRYYEVMSIADLDAIDKTTRCVKLQWQKTKNGDPWIDVLDISLIIGRFHACPDGWHPISEALCETDTERIDTWTDRNFYVNVYKVSNYEPAYFKVAASSSYKHM